MKRYNVVLTFLMLFVAAVSGPAQSPAPSPAAQQDLQRLQQLQQQQSQPATVQTPFGPVANPGVRFQNPGQRSGGGRGAAPAQTDTSAQLRKLEYGLTLRARLVPGAAWWTDTALVTRLGLTDDQKGKIQRAYENHRQDITSRSQTLDKEENQLSQLLQAESIDRNAVLAEIDRITQARSDLERANSVMTLEMRESLTREQWMQLQQTDPIWISPDAGQPRTFRFYSRQPAPPGTGQRQ